MTIANALAKNPGSASARVGLSLSAIECIRPLWSSPGS